MWIAREELKLQAKDVIRMFGCTGNRERLKKTTKSANSHWI